MIAKFWIKVEGKKNHKGWSAGKISSSKHKPSTAHNEITMKMSITIPDTLFEEPVIEAEIQIPEASVAPKITSTVAIDIANIIKEQLGVRVHITTGE